VYYSCDILKMNKSRDMRWAEHVARTGEINVNKIFDGKPQEIRTRGKCRHRLEDNIKANLRETKCAGVNWVQFDRYRALCRGTYI